MKLIAAAILSLVTGVSIEDGTGRGVPPGVGPCARVRATAARMPEGILALLEVPSAHVSVLFEYAWVPEGSGSGQSHCGIPQLYRPARKELQERRNPPRLILLSDSSGAFEMCLVLR